MNVADLHTGDFIGVCGGNSELTKAIAASRNSAGDYDHIGLIELSDNGVYVWNANPQLGVSREPLSEFIERETASQLRHFDIFRHKTDSDVTGVFLNLKRKLGLPYNNFFRASNEAFYCADLIACAYPAGFFAAKPMKFTGDYWPKYFAELETEAPDGESGFHPSDMLSHHDLVYVGELS